MRYYIDCEFDGHNGPLLSMAIVRNELNNIHIRVLNDATDPWVIANVLPAMDSHKAIVLEQSHEQRLQTHLLPRSTRRSRRTHA